MKRFVTCKPRQHRRVFVRGVVVEHDVNGLSLWHFGLDCVQETDELIVAMPLHAAADDLALENIEGGKERGRTVALVILRHGAGTALFHRKARLGAVQCLYLALFIDREHDRVLGAIDVKSHDVSQFSAKCGSLDSLNCLILCG